MTFDQFLVAVLLFGTAEYGCPNRISFFWDASILFVRISYSGPTPVAKSKNLQTIDASKQGSRLRVDAPRWPQST